MKAATGFFRGHKAYFNEDHQEWRFCDTDEATETTWFTRPCGHCGLFGSSNEGKVDPCLGNLPGVTNACCGHGDPGIAYIAFQGGLVITGFDVKEFHHRKMCDEEQRIIRRCNEDLRKFRRYRPEHMPDNEEGDNDGQ